MFGFIIDDPIDGLNEFNSTFEETEYLNRLKKIEKIKLCK